MTEGITGYLSKGGPIASAHSDFEERPQQLAMLTAVNSAIRSHRHLVAEAGTGIGKTFAYLIPAALFSLETGAPVVISTHTINLQDQLMRKDVPFLQVHSGIQFTAALLKGRSNYLCLKRLFGAGTTEQSLFDGREELDEVARISAWADSTEEGSDTDMPVKPSPSVWGKVCCDPDNCHRRKCAFHKRCFYFAARARAAKANLVISNHHLYFADLALNQQALAVLPTHDTVILDEGHRLESVAREHFGLEAASGQIARLLNSLHKARRRGLLTSFMNAREAVKAVESARSAADKLFDKVRERLASPERYGARLRTPGAFPPDAAARLIDLSNALKELRKECDQDMFLAGELDSAISRSVKTASDIAHIVDQRLPDYVYWAENYGAKGQLCSLRGAPIDVSETLRKHLFANRKSCVVTSATLSTDCSGSFGHIRSRIGLDDPDEICLGSPFDYKKNVRLFVARSLPDPENQARFIPAAAEAVTRFIRHTKGRTFVLFTSYNAMNAVWRLSKPALEHEGYDMQKQGEGVSRHRMLERFKAGEKAVIFGADSFWQGVDVPGDALQNVIIARLPFLVPSEPTVEAVCERIEQGGKSSFMEFQLPEAIIRLKQGFGRLIRTKKDKGIVVILDNRILTRWYGVRFLEALPECPIEKF